MTLIDTPVADARDLIPCGLSDPGATDGDEVAEPLQFLSDADPDANEQQARLPVRMTELWNRTDAEGNKVVGPARERTTGATVAPRSSDQSRRGLALALMRTGLYDVKPGLLALVRFGFAGDLDQVIGYGVNYVRSWAEMAGREYPADVLRAAAADALAVVVARGDDKKSRAPRASACINRHRQPVRMPISERTLELGIRNTTYGELLSVAVKAYRRRLDAAERRYIVVDNYLPITSGRSYGGGFSHESKWMPNRTTVELTGVLAATYHNRNPPNLSNRGNY
jgi:hypothetical protein